MKSLNLQAYIQPIFIDADMEIISKRVGEEHARDCYNWKSMGELGLRTSGGSDCPVEPFDILDNLRAAVTRQNRAGTRTYLPEQALTVEEGLRLFTSNAPGPAGTRRSGGPWSWASWPIWWCWMGTCSPRTPLNFLKFPCGRRC